MTKIEAWEEGDPKLLAQPLSRLHSAFLIEINFLGVLLVFLPLEPSSTCRTIHGGPRQAAHDNRLPEN
ncbi:hypothetical protein L209DRAFT_755113 [Thermothelomyces heterothallicus CBS 203.75]